MKILPSLFCMLILSFATVAQAAPEAAGATSETGTHAGFEIDSLDVKLSKDGTGIIKGPTCSKCDFKIVRITANTRAFANGVKVAISRVASRAGKPVYIRFDTSTAEVLTIRWSE